MLVFPSIRVKGVDEMKKISILLALTVMFTLFTACAEVYDYELEFTYESDKTVYLVGETVKITAKMTNISGSLPANGELLTIKVISSVGSEIFTNGPGLS